MASRCYLCQRFMAKDSQREECPRCYKRMHARRGEWIDGPKFMKWLTDHDVTHKVVRTCIGENADRRFTEWSHGKALTIFTADRYLYACGFFLSDLPDTVYRDPPPNRRQYSPEMKRQVVDRYLEGIAPLRLSAEFNMSVATVDNVLKKAGVRGSLRKRFDTIWDGIQKGKEDECWPWLGACRKRDGMPYYGARFVHRIVAEEVWGRQDTYQAVRRTCGNIKCCNPKHFESVRYGTWMKGAIPGTQGKASPRR